MGAGVSREDAEAYLTRQEKLIEKLSAIVAVKQHQGPQPGAATTSTPNGSLPSWLTTLQNRFDVESSGKEFAAPVCMSDELQGLVERARAAEKRRAEPPVEEYERELPAREWVTPNEEQAKDLSEGRPWLTVMTKPGGYEYGTTDAKPKVQLVLEHVYGYRSSGVRNNLRWVLAEQQRRAMLFSAGGIAVVQDLATHQQSFFHEHQDEITSIAVSKDGSLAATGDQGRYPSIYVWDIETKVVKAKLSGNLRRAVSSLAFSDCGTYLAGVGLDDDSSVVVYDWKRGRPVAEGPGCTRGRILQVCANREVATKETHPFLTVGESGHAQWWTFDKKSTSNRAKATSKALALGSLGDKQTFTTAHSSSEFTVIGTQNGELYVCSDSRLLRVVDGHHGPLMSITANASASTIVTGGYDGYVSQWSVAQGFRRVSSKLVVSPTEDTSNSGAVELHGRPNSIRSLDVLTNPLNGSIQEVLVGCVSGSIHSFQPSDESVRVVAAAHGGDLSSASCIGELSGLATHPREPYFVSVGETTVFVWDAQKKTAIKKIRLPARGQCVTWSPSGQYIIVGLHSGVFLVFNTTKYELVKEVRASLRRVQCARFSADGTVLAVGTADNQIQLYDASNGSFDLGGKLTGPKGVILSIDFSADSKLLQCSTQAYELVYFDIAEMRMLPPEDAKLASNVAYSTFTSLLGWSVQGIWPQGSQLDDVNSVARSARGDLIATAEETGLVKIFQYPCVGGGIDYSGVLARRPDAVRGSGHGGKVTQVQWMNNDATLITAGGEDLSCLQWRVVPLS